MTKTRTQSAPKIPAPAAPAPFDLASRYAADRVTVPIFDPADIAAKRDTGLRVEICSLYSKEARDAAIGARTKLKLVDGKIDAADADFEQNLFEQTVAVVTRWWDENGDPAALLVDGEMLPCTPKNVRRLFSDPRTAWLQKQVQAAYLDLSRFFATPKSR